MKDKLTSAEMATALGVSGGYARRLIRYGMPADSVQAARDWIRKRSKQLGTDAESKLSLNELRAEKIRLECEILALRLERERDDVELVPVGELEKFIGRLLRSLETASTLYAEEVTNNIVGKSELEIYEEIRNLFTESLIGAALSYVKAGGPLNPDKRIIAYAERCIERQFGWRDRAQETA